MDATGLKQTTPQDQAAELRKLVARPTESAGAVGMSVDVTRSQAASLVLLAQLVREGIREKGVAA